MRLDLADRRLREIPPGTQTQFKGRATEVDLTDNALTDAMSLAGFEKLDTLVLDGNKISSQSKLPFLPSLRTLWVNRNKISNLAVFMDLLAVKTPNLRYLSMLKNDACPNFFNESTPRQYLDYRLFVISRLKHLKHLDYQGVEDSERAEAERVYGSYVGPNVVPRYSASPIKSPARPRPAATKPLPTQPEPQLAASRKKKKKKRKPKPTPADEPKDEAPERIPEAAPDDEPDQDQDQDQEQDLNSVDGDEAPVSELAGLRLPPVEADQVNPLAAAAALRAQRHQAAAEVDEDEQLDHVALPEVSGDELEEDDDDDGDDDEDWDQADDDGADDEDDEEDWSDDDGVASDPNDGWE